MEKYGKFLDIKWITLITELKQRKVTLRNKCNIFFNKITQNLGLKEEVTGRPCGKLHRNFKSSVLPSHI